MRNWPCMVSAIHTADIQRTPKHLCDESACCLYELLAALRLLIAQGRTHVLKKGVQLTSVSVQVRLGFPMFISFAVEEEITKHVWAHVSTSRTNASTHTHYGAWCSYLGAGQQACQPAGLATSNRVVAIGTCATRYATTPHPCTRTSGET